ncbi:MAG: hypothetical protein M0Z71_04705 [Nitrospiraceae bacterium]|nr:hypothetical protein [Nitrospiraceae bacterium]
MGSFVTVINNLVTLLQGTGTPLQVWSQSKFNRSVIIKKVYKNRTEVNASDLPIILIARPLLEKSYLINASRNGKHTVRFYAGFHQPDRRVALDQFIEFEEMIDDTLLSVPPESLGAIILDPKHSANDEGKFHPYYFHVCEIEIKHRR